MGSPFFPTKKFAVSLLAASIALTACDNAPDNDDDNNDGDVAGYLQRDIRDDVFYFVMPDRFSNGNPANDYGDLSGDKFTHGFDDTDKAFYHGGDVVGLKDKLDYLEGLGVTAIWMTPILKNKAVQGESAGYHGYWTLDFTQIDPHLGTNEDLKELIDAAHERDIKIFFDIITNHTADVIKYEECHDADGEFLDGDSCAYKSLEDVAGGDTYTPFVPAGEENAKVPAWLNDPSYYHNQGDSTFSGENSIYGDFVGLDDLDTLDPDVISGMIDIFKNIVTEFKPDGFRIDTVKHVHIEFWQEFSPALVEHAKAEGIENFFMFGEVYDGNPDFLSTYTTEGKLQSVLDFGFQGTVSDSIKGGSTPSALKGFFEQDDKYNDADSNADQLLNFVGNHDMGRFGLGLSDNEDDLAKTKLAHAMMYFLRGVPVIYYGDEQGFTGDGNDQDARENMFPSNVEVYNDNELIGTSATTADDNFDETHPIYQTLAEYAEVYKAHDALRSGVQHERFANDATKGLYVVSRVDNDEQVEYVVAFNTSNIPATEYVPAAASGYTGVYGFDGAATIDQGDIELTVPAYGVVILKADETVTASPATTIALTGIEADSFISGRIEVGLDIAGLDELALPTYAALFEVSTDGGATWDEISIDQNSPYRAFFRTQDIANGTEVTVRATVTNGSAMVETATVSAVVDSRYPEVVTIQYANGNAQEALYVVSNGGEFQSKNVGNAGSYDISWGENDEANLLLFATLDDEAGTAEFDQPYLLERSTVLANSVEDGNGGLTASLSVDQLTAVDLSLTTVDQIVQEGLAVNSEIDGLNLRGGIVGWGQADAVDMTNTEYSTYHAEAVISRGDGEFKFADDGWAAINIGGPVSDIGLVQSGNPSNLLNDFEASSAYDFWVVGVDTDGDGAVDLRVPFVEVDHGEFGELLYLRGDMNSFAGTADQLVHQGNDVYELLVTDLAAGTYEFKLTNDDWSSFFDHSEMTYVYDNSAITIAEGAGDDPNVSMTLGTDNDVNFSLDLSDPLAPVLTLTPGEVPTYSAEGDLYVKGELNGWGNNVDYIMAYQGADVYSLTVGIDPASFDYTGDNATNIDFAIANASWGYKLAAGDALLTLDGTINLAEGTGGANNLLDPTLTAGYYTLTLDASVNAAAPTLSLAANADYTYGDYFGESMFVRGDFNSWANDVAVTQDGNMFTYEVTLAVGTRLFKIVNDDWSNQIQFGNIVQDGGLDLSGADDGFGGLNISVDIDTADTYLITLDVTNPVTPTLTVEAVTP